jgi:putative ABC transport system permease protein
MLGHYFDIAIRNIRRSPFTAVVNVATLALGLTSFVAAYTVVAYWGNSERHFANADRTYVITASLALKDGSISTGTVPQTNELYERYIRIDYPEIEAIAKANMWNRQSSVTADGKGARVIAVAVDPEFLDIFDLPFSAGDRKTALRDPNGILLTETAALRLFGTREVLGKTVTLGNNLIDATITGVVAPIPEPSHLGTSPTATFPFEMMASYPLYERLREIINRPQNPQPGAPPAAANGSAAQSASNGSSQEGAQRAADGASPETAPEQEQENWLGGYCCVTYVMVKRDSAFTGAALQRALRDFAGRHVPPDQLAIANVDVGAVPVTSMLVARLDSQLFGGRSPMSATTILFALGALVLLVACVNYANLATARATRRAREIGLRKVIGARRGQIIAQYLFEAGLLTITALVTAVGIVALIAPLVKSTVGIDIASVMFSDARFWVFIAALLAAVTVLGGAYPALVLSGVRPIEALRLGRVRIGPRFASTVLVGAQFAAASFLLIGVIVMYMQNAALQRTGLGSTRDQHLVINNFQPVTRVSSDVLRAELERLPQVKGITGMGSAPWGENVNLNLLARTPEEGAPFETSFQNNVEYDFFSTLDIPVLAGRVFDREHNDLPPQTDDEQAPTAAINIVIDRILAAQLGFASPQAAVDQTVWSPAIGAGDRAQPFNIIGVVESRPLFLRGLGATSNVYNLGSNAQNIIVRLAADDIGGGLAAAEAMWRRLVPQATFSRRFMDEMFNDSYEQYARVSQALTWLAGFAFAISVIGLFGMAVQTASRRIHEIGVRKSVGARTGQIVAMLLRDFSRPVVIANLLVWVPAFYVLQKYYLSVFIQRITLTPVPFVLSLAIVVAIACAAVGSQALRASRASPARVLRFE